MSYVYMSVIMYVHDSHHIYAFISIRFVFVRKREFGSRESLFLAVPWLIYVFFRCAMTHLHMWHDSFLHVAWLIFACNMVRASLSFPVSLSPSRARAHLLSRPLTHSQTHTPTPLLLFVARALSRVHSSFLSHTHTSMSGPVRRPGIGPESWHTYEWVMSETRVRAHLWMSHERDMAHTCIKHMGWLRLARSLKF